MTPFLTFLTSSDFILALLVMAVVVCGVMVAAIAFQSAPAWVRHIRSWMARQRRFEEAAQRYFPPRDER